MTFGVFALVSISFEVSAIAEKVGTFAANSLAPSVAWLMGSWMAELMSSVEVIRVEWIKLTVSSR